jgi:broad specificity phosphatase PhoE
VNELVVARHAESEASVQQLLNGDASVQVALTELGRQQARALGEAVGPVDLAAHTEFGRTRETVELAWPDAPTLVVPELNEIRFGRFEGTFWHDGYDMWVLSSSPEDESPGGGESRAGAVRRYVSGYRLLLERPEKRVVLVAHGAAVRYVLLALEGFPPRARLEQVEPAQPFAFTRDDLESALEVLETWVATPAF